MAKPKKYNPARIKPKYKRTPSPIERRYHIAIMELPCMGCGSCVGVVAHHPLMQSARQRWRRDHEFVVPVCHPCHSAIHDSYGDETQWSEHMQSALPVHIAENLREEYKARGYLNG